MAYSYTAFTGNGSTTQYAVSFPYIRREHVAVTVAGVPSTFTWVNNSLIQMDAAPANGAAVRVYRTTPISAPLVDFADGATLVAADLDTNSRQSIYIQQELDDAQTDNLPNVIPNGNKGDITTSVGGTVWAINTGAVLEAKIATGAVTETKLGTGSVTSAKIADGTIVNADVNASAGIAASKLAFTQAGTGATARTIDSKLKDVVSVKDFGAVGDGTTDDRTAIQAALTASTSVYFPTPSVSYYLSDSVSPQSNTTIFGDGAASHIQVIDGTVNCFYLNGVSGVVVRDLKISTKLQTNATAYKCAVLMANECRNCIVENVQVFNWGHWGVAIFSSSNCIVRGCRFSSWFGTVGDSAQIVIYKTSSNNLIEGNYCSAATDHGIFMQDPYAGDTPTGNSIVNNYVSAAKGDGISVYVTSAYDTQTLILGNRIFDIAGTFLSGQSGHGIYIQSCGGALVTNNTISNCCISTSSFETQVVAAIGVSTGDIATYPTGTINEVIVSNNHITAQRGPGISVQTCDVPVLVEGNHILSTGTAAIRGEAIYTVNADGVQIKNNTIKHSNTNYNAINIGASNKNLKGISVVGNRIRGTTYGIGFNSSGTGTFADTVITGNIITGLSGIALFLQKVSNSQISNNNLESTGPVFSLTTSSRVRMTANRFYSNYGSYSIIFTGAAGSNAGTIADESNDFQGVIQNDAGTGAILSRYADSFPGASGVHAIGDRVIQSVPVVGQPKGWRCTVAGSPGTWASEGNL